MNIPFLSLTRDVFLMKLYSMGLLPKIIRGTKKYSILNHIMCEAHYDKLLFSLTHNN